MFESHERLHLSEITKMAKNDISLVLRFVSLYIADLQEIKTITTSLLLEKNDNDFRAMYHRYLPALKIVHANGLINKLDECKLALLNPVSLESELYNLANQVQEICDANLLELLTFQTEQMEKQDAKAKL